MASSDLDNSSENLPSKAEVSWKKPLIIILLLSFAFFGPIMCDMVCIMLPFPLWSLSFFTRNFSDIVYICRNISYLLAISLPSFVLSSIAFLAVMSIQKFHSVKRLSILTIVIWVITAIVSFIFMMFLAYSDYSFWGSSGDICERIEDTTEEKLSVATISSSDGEFTLEYSETRHKGREYYFGEIIRRKNNSEELLLEFRIENDAVTVDFSDNNWSPDQRFIYMNIISKDNTNSGIYIFSLDYKNNRSGELKQYKEIDPEHNPWFTDVKWVDNNQLELHESTGKTYVIDVDALRDDLTDPDEILKREVELTYTYRDNDIPEDWVLVSEDRFIYQLFLPTNLNLSYGYDRYNNYSLFIILPGPEVSGPQKGVLTIKTFNQSEDRVFSTMEESLDYITNLVATESEWSFRRDVLEISSSENDKVKAHIEIDGPDGVLIYTIVNNSEEEFVVWVSEITSTSIEEGDIEMVKLIIESMSDKSNK